MGSPAYCQYFGKLHLDTRFLSPRLLRKVWLEGPSLTPPMCLTEIKGLAVAAQQQGPTPPPSLPKPTSCTTVIRWFRRTCLHPSMPCGAHQLCTGVWANCSCHPLLEPDKVSWIRLSGASRWRLSPKAVWSPPPPNIQPSPRGKSCIFVG